MDFFIPKTSLLAYIENGLLYYTDIKYKMSVDERLAHIEHVLDISKRNPNLNFYVIDDDSDQIPIETFRLSIYANINRVFLKNIARFHGPHGPQHYSILSEEMAAAIYDAIDGLKAIESCHHYDFQRLTNFIDKNRKLIDRIIFLSELANPF